MDDYSQHLAVKANLASVKHAMAKNRAAWLALYHPDAVVCDPVGVSMFDPTGEGHRGIDAIAAFFDNVIAGANTSMEIGEHRVGGLYTCAVPMRATNDLGESLNGQDIQIHVDMISVYKVDEQGLILSLEAYWDWAEMEAKLADIFAQN